MRKPHFYIKDRIKLIFFGYMNKITSTVELDYNAMYNYFYNLISHGIRYSDGEIWQYYKYFNQFISLLWSFVLIRVNRTRLTYFEHISIKELLKVIIIPF